MKSRKLIFLFVLIIAVFLLVFQWMIMTLRSDGQQNLLVGFLLNLPFCVVIGLVDLGIIHIVYKNPSLRNRTSIRIAVDLILSALLVSILAALANYALGLLFPKMFPDSGVSSFSLPLLIWNSIIVLLIEIFFYNQRQIEAEKKMALMEKEKMRYQYEMLKAQINPHFLFNSLNVLSSLAYQDAEKANLFAKKMSGIYRYLLLTNERPTVTLKEELAFLDSYLFLEQIRFENALFVEIDNRTDANPEVIPVSLQLLVENAIKHNITTPGCPLTVRITISDEWITVSNNLQLRSTVDKGGVGLKNLRDQYTMHNKTIEISNTGTEFVVKIPFLD